MDSSKNFSIKTIILSIVTLITYAFSQKCRTYKCEKLEKDLCLKLNYTVEFDEVSAQFCSDNTKTCPYYKLSAGDEVKCEDAIKLPFKQYPGGPCKTRDDCLNNYECKESKCIGKAENERCERHDECYYGFSCYKLSKEANFTTCNKLRQLNSQCDSEFECQMSQGCFNGNCTDYFSLDIGSNLGSNKNNNQYSFCSSGHDRHGICDSMSNINEKEQVSDDLVKCNEANPCRYTSYNGTIQENDVCTCGKSVNGDRFCPIYGGNKKFKNAVKILKEMVKSDKSNCNTLERGVVCNNVKSSTPNGDSILTFETIVTKLESYHEFAFADECVQKIFYPRYSKNHDKDPVDPDQPTDAKCPIYRCSSDNNQQSKTCATNSYDEKDTKSYVDLFTNSCKWESEFCNFSRTYMKKEKLNSLCKTKDVPTGKRYPGEDCNDNTDCFLLNGKPYQGVGECDKNKKCTGMKSGDVCSHTSQCFIGLYCKFDSAKNSTTCQSQEKEDASCDSMFDCRNNLVCSNKQCKNSYFSLEAGDVFELKNFTNTDLTYLNNLCKFGLVQSDNVKGVCLIKKQEDTIDSNQENLVPCNYGQSCNYTITDNKNINIQKPDLCVCGYNSKGQGYCPLGHNINTNTWNDYLREKRSNLENECHSLNRFECYKSKNDNLLSLIKKTNDLHLFYGAEKCSFQVLSGVFIKVSTLFAVLCMALLY